MIILSNVHSAHVCTCVCVCVHKTRNFHFSMTLCKRNKQLYFLIAKKENLQFIITFLHEKRAKPIALAHIGRNGRFQASHIQGRVVVKMVSYCCYIYSHCSYLYNYYLLKVCPFHHLQSWDHNI
jgi:hypothetical protein